MKHYFFLILCLAIRFSLPAGHIPYLTSECDIYSIVDNVVNAYNGKLVQVDHDIRVEGSDPLEMTFFYDGGHHFGSEFGYGIGCNYPALLFLSEDDRVSLELRQGMEVLCKIKKCKSKKHKKFAAGGISNSYYKSGYINSCEALLQGEPPLAALQVELMGDKDAKVILGDGTKRYYTFFDYCGQKGNYYRLNKEIRPNGNKRYFSYTSNTFPFNLSRVWTTSRDGSLTLNWIEFSYHGNDVYVKASNGQRAHYVLKLEKGKVKNGSKLQNIKGKVYENVLVSASSNHYPATSYEIETHSKSFDTIFSRSKAKLPKGRFIEVTYNSDKKISALKASGIDRSLYTFKYHKNFTEVEDANGGVKKYEFNHRRPSQVIEKNRKQIFDWDDKGQLTTYQIQHPNGKEVCKKDYKYDERGNIKEIKVRGNITGIGSQDCDIISYTYWDYNRVRTENHNQSIEYTFDYLDETNLLIRKLTYADQGFREREFYDYDHHGILIRKIVDDGAEPDFHNLTLVSYRLITEIEPQLDPNQPGLTHPHFISEWYLDLATGNKHLLKKKELIYVRGDLLAEEKVFDANGAYCYSLHYAYNDRRELISEKNALGEETIYGYDDNGNKTYVEKIGSEKKTSYIYDLANRLIEEREEHPDKVLKKMYSYDALGNRISETDIYQRTTTYQYDLSNREVAVQDPLGCQEYKEYDALGNISKIVDKNGHTTKTLYNLLGKPLQIAHPDDTFERYAYNIEGHVVREWKRDGTYLCYDVDYKGRVLKSETFSSHGNLLKTLLYTYKGPNLIAEVDALGNETRYFYDYAGRKTAKTQGHISTFYEYDSLGRLNKTITDNQVAITEYDYLDRIIEERIEDASGNIFRKIQYEYDIYGNEGCKREYKNALDYAETRTLYNSQNQPILHIDSLGFKKEIFYHQTDHLEKETIDALGRRTIEIFDPLHRVCESKTLSSGGLLLAHSSFAYDGKGNQIKRSDDILLNGALLGSYQVTTSYDCMDQKTQETEQESKTTRWQYKQGRLDTITKPDGTFITHEYDPLGRLQEQKASDGTIFNRFVYDLNDNLIMAEDVINSNTIKRSYDNHNRLIYEKQAAGQECFFSYDHLNRLLDMQFDENKISYEYSPTTLISSSRYKGNALAYTSTQTCDWLDKVTKLKIFDIEFIYNWDLLGRCQNICAPGFNQTFVYDAVGNLIQTSVQDGIGTYEAKFEYDGLNQLIQETGPLARDYSYDSLRNRRSKNNINLEVDFLNQLKSDGDNDYTYDDNGRRLTKDEANYKYDALGRLISFSNGLDHIVYHYDALGRRINLITPDYTLHYLYQFDTEIGNGHQFRMLHPQHATIAIELDDRIYIPIRNHRGDIVQLLNEEGNPIATYRYDAFGHPSIQGKPSPWLFSGQRYEPAAELYHFSNRDYDPCQGRWLTPDPLGFAEGPNLYAYVHNNPLIYVDPYGLWKEETKDFCHGFTRGAVDDTTWGLSNRVLGEYKPSSSLERAGHYTGTAASMLAGFVYGAAEVRLAKGAWQIFKNCIPKTTQASKIFQASYKGANNTKTTAQKVFEQIKGTDKVVTKEKLLNGPACNTANAIRLKNFLIGKEIASGHAFEKHVLNQGEFRGLIRTREQFAQHIENILNNPSAFKQLRNNRSGYWHRETGTVIVRNPNASDGGTAFQPRNGFNYYQENLR